MRQKSGPGKQPAAETIEDIRRATRRHFSAEEKIRIVLEGLRGGHRLVDGLRLVERVPGGRQETASRGHGARREL
jgi:hypothetical protein